MSENVVALPMPPRMTATDHRLRALGYDGDRIYPGQLDYQEWHKDLRSPFQKQKIYQQMLANDPEIAQSFALPVDLLAAGKWRVVPPEGMGKDPRAQDAADFCKQVLADCATPWRDTLDDMLTGVPWGWSLCELVWKRRDGMRAKVPSRYNDGLLGLHKIELRPQYTAYGWMKDPEGEIIAFRQRDPLTGAIADIPLEKALHITFGAGTTGPEGKAGLRRLYIPYRNGTRLTEIMLIGEEHRGAGCWIGTAPAELIAAADAGDAVAEARISDFLQGLMQLSVGERGVLVAPHPKTPDGKDSGWSVELKSTGGTSNNSAGIELLRMFRERIMIGIGTQYLLLGMNGSTGGKAQTVDQTRLAATILQGTGNRVCGTISSQLFPRICAYNGIDGLYSPRMVYTHPKRIDLTSFAQLIGAAQAVGVPLVDTKDRDELREQAGLSTTEGDL